MQIQNAIITGSFSYNGADLSNVTSSNAYSASLSSRTTNLESTSSVLVGASASFSSILTSVSSSQQQLSSSFLTLTASFNAVSASQQQISSSYIALSGSYNVFSGSASTRITVDSASLLQVSSSQQQISASLLNVISIFATTGSNSFRADQSITGSLVVSSTITAQTLVVQTVTSSIVYSSGSNLFGSALGDRQTFTGSVLITGSLTIAGASSATSYSGATIFGSTIACSPIGCFATSCATSFIGGTGTLSGDLTLQGAVTRNIKFLDNTNTNLNAQIQYDQISSTSGQLLFGTNNAGTFATRLTISNTGASTFSSTITGTTIYGSTAVCSAVGYFSGCVGVGFTGYGGSKLTLVASANPTCASSANMQLSIGEASQNTTYSFKLGYIYVGGGYVGAIQTIAGGVASTTVINPDGGNVGIGTSAPQSSYKVTISGTDTVYPAIYLDNTTNGQAYSIRATGTNFSIRDNSSGNDRITLTCVGNVGIGANPSSYGGYLNMTLQSTGASGVNLDFKTCAGTREGVLLLASGTEFSLIAATAIPLTFRTNDTERMRITSEGYLGTTITSTSVTCGDLLGLLSFVSRDSSTYSSGGITNIRSYATETYNTSTVGGDLRFYVSDGLQNTTGNFCFGTEAMRIGPAGRVGIGGCAGTNAKLHVFGDVAIGDQQSGGDIRLYVSGPSSTRIPGLFNNTQGGSGSENIVLFQRGGTTVGSISSTNAATAYNTTSDYRLKEDLKEVSGLDKISAIKVYDFKWKNSDNRMDGVLAHELQQILPYAVIGEKDAEQMQGVDYSKLTPVLIKAIQEQQCTINTLKTCLGIA